MVILMNSAFEALRFSSLIELSQDKCREYFPGHFPKLAVLTSESDYATKWAFPTDRIFSTMFDRHRTMDRYECTKPSMSSSHAIEIPQGKAKRTTIGHFEPYQTHRLAPATAASPTEFDLEHAYFDWSASDNSKPDDYTAVDLVSKERTTKRNPYMNFAVEKDLMDAHNDIWGDEVLCFIRELITVSTTPIEGYEKLIAE